MLRRAILAVLLLGLATAPVLCGEQAAGGLSARISDPEAFGRWHLVDLYQDAWVVLRGKANGNSTDILLDSGAGITVFSDAFAEGLDLEMIEAGTIEGIGGRQRLRLTPPVEIAVGGIALSLPRAAVVDLSLVEEHLGRPVPVILGMELFRLLVVDLDYPRKRIALRDPRGYRYDGEGRALAMKVGADGYFQVAGRVEDLPRGLFNVDTGSGGALDLVEHLVRRHALLEGRQPQSVRITGGVGGAREVPVASLASFELGGYRFERVPAEFHTEKGGALDSVNLDGNLGAGILSRFRCTFHARGDRLFLEPGPDWDRPLRRDLTGLQTLRRADHLEVFHVAPGSPASGAGWKPGDRIVAVGRQSISTMASGEDDTWKWEPVEEIILTDGEGRERRLTPAPYY